MSRMLLITLIFALTAVAAPVLAQADDAPRASTGEQATVEQGQAIYDSVCHHCHGDEGGGYIGRFPELEENQSLESLELIVRNVRRGIGDMPAFLMVDAEQLAAVATYIRTSWGNDFGRVSPEDVQAVLEDLDGRAERTLVSVWDGVYTEEQAARGREAFTGHCAQCHGTRGDGARGRVADMPVSPSLVNDALFQSWGGSPVASLFRFTETTMPQLNPGALSVQEYTDAITYLFQISDIPTGDTELPADPVELETVVIESPPEE